MDRKLNNFAYYRLPGQSHYTFMAQSKGEPSAYGSVAELDEEEGFVMAPFMVSRQHPVLVMHPDVVENHEIQFQQNHVSTKTTAPERPTEKAAYASAFAKFHAETQAGKFGKIVLSRCSPTDLSNDRTPQDLFLKACNIYPYQFVALVCLHQAGTWLMATPEILLDGNPEEWHTMALAGTMKRQEGISDVSKTEWTKKNRDEQQYVSTYIKDVLSKHADHISEQGPYTVAAAHLLHLRTDFTFKLNNTTNVGALIEALYPTPAVCGIPKEKARAFISAYEQIDRKYYSGFCGPLSLHGENHLYVALRCMEIVGKTANLYAGGGILHDSNMEREWKETQTKMLTMHRLLNN